MDPRQLETFLKVAHKRSVTRAAAELRYAQSTVTAQIKGLESDLNVSLFERNGRGVRLTAAGEQLLPYAERILDLIAEARRHLHPEREPNGILIIGTMESITSYRLPPLLELFHYRYPKVRLSLRPTSCTETQTALRQGTFDVGFLMEQEHEHPGLATVVLCKETLILVAAPDHPLAREQRIETEHLRSTNILGTEPGCVYRDKFEELLSDDGAEPSPVLEFGTIEAIKRSAEARLGVALLPEVTVAAELDAGSLVALPWQAPFQVYTQLAWNDNKWLSPEVQLFITEAARVVREAAAGVQQPAPSGHLKGPKRPGRQD